MFTVYRITNAVNGKTYVGVHKTKNPNDGYFGSGRAIRAAIKKHGKSAFRKEVLFVFETSAEAYAKEIELTADFHISSTYNMRRGGVGGFTRENALKSIAALPPGTQRRAGMIVWQQKKGCHSLTRKQLSENGRKGGLAMKGYVKTPEHRERLRQAAIRQWTRQKEAKSKSGDPLLITE